MYVPQSLNTCCAVYTTGQISVKESLDHEALNKHQLVIMARDKGVKPYRSFAKVVINVEDHNDHAPEFLSGRFEGRVFETAAIGTSVVQVMAFDRDKGDNAEIQYSIVSGKSHCGSWLLMCW